MARTAAVLAGLHALVSVSAGDPSKRLRIRNGCDRETLWIAHEAGAGIGPDRQNLKIWPGDHHDFATSNGLSATRYWPKMRCDPSGNHCRLGGSGGPGQACVRGSGAQADYTHCAPPIDTKFEATFGIHGLGCNPDKGHMMGCDYIDMSLVDGFTLPFTLKLHGSCTGKEGVMTEIDCSRLSIDLCPDDEYLEAAHTTVSLKAMHPMTGEVAGCYSPCQKLLDSKWNNTFAVGRHKQDRGVVPYCCPTPPETPAACRAGPLQQTAFVRHVRRFCPDVYTFAYDDAVGLMRCSSETVYELTFMCPPTTTFETYSDSTNVLRKFQHDGKPVSSPRPRPSVAVVAAAGAVLFLVVTLTTIGLHRARRPCYNHLPGGEGGRTPRVETLSKDVTESDVTSSPWMLTTC